MNSTKDKILEAALKLFNNEGTDVITVRHIAKELNISHGNLCYHFPNTAAIIEKLYNNLVDELNTVLSQTQTQTISLHQLTQSGRATFKIQYKYRFLMLDFVRIMRAQPSIKNHFQQLMDMRRQQFKIIFSHLQHQQILKPEPLPGLYDLIIEQFFLIGDFWMSHAEIMFNGSEAEKIEHYLKVMQASLIPCLTPKGLAQLST